MVQDLKIMRIPDGYESLILAVRTLQIGAEALRIGAKA
jgi:hypothetical protein